MKLTADALVLPQAVKESPSSIKFPALSAECARSSDRTGSIVAGFPLSIDLDYFQLIDQKIISDQGGNIVPHRSAGDVTLWVRRRRQGRWYTEYSHLYEAIEYAARFLHALDEANLSMESLADGVQRYCSSWYRIDQLYRKFTYHVRMSGQATLTGTLSERIENLYSNSSLLKLGDAFQGFVEAASSGKPFPSTPRRSSSSSGCVPFCGRRTRCA